MKSIADIRHSIRAIEDTAQITRAMNLISTAKMRKALKKYDANAVHFQRVQSTMKDILTHTKNLEHPYIGQSEGGRAAYVVIAADKGLCGGYNHNVLNFALKYMQKSKEKYILTVGQEVRVFFEKRDYMIDVEFLNMSQNPSLYNARSICNDLLDLYNSGLMDETYVIYTKYVSSTIQTPRVLKLLPINIDNFAGIETEVSYTAEMNYHPTPESVFDTLVPQYVIGLIYGCMVQSYASEQCARMMAMDNATRNAEDMVSNLTQELNRARQSAVTSEICEIISALEVLT